MDQVISEIRPVASDPTMRRVRVGNKTVATLRAADIESLGLEIGAKWTVDLAQRAEACMQMNKARRAALMMLGRRPFSRGELVERLMGKQIDPALAQQVVDELAADRWIDDEAYARSLAVEKARRSPTSRQVLQSKLESRRIDADLAERAAAETLTEIDTVESALALIRRRLGTMSKLPPHKARQRIGALLARRGFDEDFIAGILERLGLPGQEHET